ncbi:hypothetical protein [Alicyclobacillus shizuokensis]|uniref:hypothetical protein n=1 Tax=Alicyclobacillus shizuokensis TaxID=392014 RepID=UPI00083180F6|nr:hypothetical protein [Alicyclobacillus shizuokensis]
MTSSRDESIEEIRQQVKHETLESVAMQLFDLLPVPTIAKVCGMTVEEVLNLAKELGAKGEVVRDRENMKKPHSIRLLDKPISQTRVPMAQSTKNAIRKHKEALAKLQRVMEESKHYGEWR